MSDVTELAGQAHFAKAAERALTVASRHARRSRRDCQRHCKVCAGLLDSNAASKADEDVCAGKRMPAAGPAAHVAAEHRKHEAEAGPLAPGFDAPRRDHLGG